jgi:hypothetical protein
MPGDAHSIRFLNGLSFRSLSARIPACVAYLELPSSPSDFCSRHHDERLNILVCVWEEHLLFQGQHQPFEASYYSRGWHVSFAVDSAELVESASSNGGAQIFLVESV